VLATLLDRSEGAALPLPASLTERYGGELRFPTDRVHVFANFVSSSDGVVSFAVPGKTQASFISKGEPADRFVLGLLRAAADAVIVGAGTLREERNGLWTPEQPFPEAAAGFAELRHAMHAADRPLMVIVTASGDLDLKIRALAEGAPILVLTTASGAKRLAGAPTHLRVRALEHATAAEILEATVAETRGKLILTEGGPTLLGHFLRERLLDELFLTIAPRIVGRDEAARRLALVEGAAFLPGEAPESRLLSVKTAGDYLLLRFARRP
jgi:riboflavin biosynthesis pyrimidine reductase